MILDWYWSLLFFVMSLVTFSFRLLHCLWFDNYMQSVSESSLMSENTKRACQNPPCQGDHRETRTTLEALKWCRGALLCCEKWKVWASSTRLFKKKFFLFQVPLNCFSTKVNWKLYFVVSLYSLTKWNTFIVLFFFCNTLWSHWNDPRGLSMKK